METKKTEFKFRREFYRLQRGVTRVLTIPFRKLSEGPCKTKIRTFILNFQNSLPTEFVVNNGDVVIQIGTPWPKTMKRFLRAVGANGKLIIVEAMPENQQRLERVIKEENIENVLLIKGAASNENRSGELLISPYKGDHKIEVPGVVMDNDLKPGNDYVTRVPVKFFKLDDELARFGISKFDYISITVNGAEAEVLKGVSNMLKQCEKGTRVYAKGHALGADNQPIHHLAQRVMIENGYDLSLIHI